MRIFISTQCQKNVIIVVDIIIIECMIWVFLEMRSPYC